MYKDELRTAKSALSNQLATLCIDGWSGITNCPVVGITITSNSVTHLVDTVDTTGHPHDSEYMTSLALEGIQKAESIFGVTITSVCTDGAANMTAMRRKLMDAAAHKNLVTYHCQPHLLNLLAKDIGSEQSATINKVIAVCNVLRNKHKASAELKSRGINKPPLPADTRWNTVRDTLRYYVNNWAKLVEISCEIFDSTCKERRYLESMPIRSAAVDLLVVFDAISQALNTLQSDSANIADALQEWLKLIQQLKQLNNNDVINLAMARCNTVTSNPCFLAANLLDPRYEGHQLTPAQIKQAINYITSMKLATTTHLTLLLAKAEPYNMDLGSDVSPVVYWRAGKRLGFSQDLIDVATILLSAVANSACLERQFSTLKLTYGSLRTKLGVEKAGNLAFCYRSINNI